MVIVRVSRCLISVLLISAALLSPGISSNVHGGAFAQVQEQEKPSYLVSVMLTAIADRIARSPGMADAMVAAGAMAPTIAELSEKIYELLHPKIIGMSTLYSYLTEKKDLFAKLVQEAVRTMGQIKKITIPEDLITKIGEDIQSNIASFRITSLEGETVTDLIIGVVTATLDEFFTSLKCLTQEQWDTLLGKVVDDIREQVLDGAPWDEREILAKIISINTGLTTQEILDNPEASAITEAIGRLAKEWQGFLNAALWRVRTLQVEELGSKLDALSEQLATLKRDVQSLKGRKEPLTLALTAIAFLLGAVSLALALRKRQKPG